MLCAMPLRICFTTEDMARTHIAEAPRPLIELNIALRQLQEGSHPGYDRDTRQRGSGMILMP
jgi:hypothetical protein